MKINYFGRRLILFILGLVCLRYIAFYSLPSYIREDGFAFIAEFDRFFTLCFIFSIAFLIYSFFEIFNHSKKKDIKLKKQAIWLSIIALATTILFFAFYRIYS